MALAFWPTIIPLLVGLITQVATFSQMPALKSEQLNPIKIYISLLALEYLSLIQFQALR